MNPNNLGFTERAPPVVATQTTLGETKKGTHRIMKILKSQIYVSHPHIIPTSNYNHPLSWRLEILCHSLRLVHAGTIDRVNNGNYYN